MRILIDIPEEDYKKINSREKLIELSCNIAYEIANGIPIPDNATNGEVLMMMFPPSEYMNDEWWNAPYQKGGKE